MMLDHKTIFKKSSLVLFFVGMGSLLCVTLLAKRVEAGRAEFLAAQEKLNLYRSEIWYIQKINREDLERRLVQELTRFTNANEIPLVIDQFFKLGAEYQIQIESAIPSNLGSDNKVLVGDVDAFRSVQIEMKAKGAYKDFPEFLKALKEMRIGVVVIDSFELRSSILNLQEISALIRFNVFVKKDANQNILDLRVAAPQSNKASAKSRSPELGRNPFVKGDANESADLNIEGIIYDPINPMVLINGDVRKQGDNVSGMTIVKIMKDSVQLEKNGKKIVRELKQS